MFLKIFKALAQFLGDQATPETIDLITLSSLLLSAFCRIESGMAMAGSGIGEQSDQLGAFYYIDLANYAVQKTPIWSH